MGDDGNDALRSPFGNQYFLVEVEQGPVTDVGLLPCAGARKFSVWRE